MMQRGSECTDVQKMKKAVHQSSPFTDTDLCSVCRHIINIQKNEMLSASHIVVLALQLWTIQITECEAQSGRSV